MKVTINFVGKTYYLAVNRVVVFDKTDKKVEDYLKKYLETKPFAPTAQITFLPFA